MMTKISPQRPLLDSLAQIKEEIGSALGIRLTEQDFADGRDELLHVYCHEACHAALAHGVPWLAGLPEEEHTVVDETLARLLEKEFAPRLGLFLHSDEAFLVELSMYPVDLERETFRQLCAVWAATFWPRRDLAGMAVHTLLTLRHGDLVYHILPRADWARAKKGGVYRPASLEKDGFIHFSRVEQVLPVACNFYQDLKDLLLLTVATDQVAGEIRSEDLLGEGQRFPHLYAPLDLRAVVAVDDFGRDETGAFQLPQQPPREA
jgi:uncharacterized protein (DUF952 family)